MTHSFKAFVDESGSEGDPNVRGGFEFIILSAAVFRTRNMQFSSEIWQNAARYRQKALGHFCRDFKDINSDMDKYLLACMIAQMPMRFCTVIVHKPSLTSLGEKYGDIYHYASQLLIERISWICRDAHKASPETDRRCSITFSERKSLRADTFKGYCAAVLEGKGPRSSHVAKEHIDVEAIRDRPHKSCEALRVADFIASSFGAALETNKKFGLTDDRFLVSLMPCAYKPRDKKVWTNGIKLFPPEAETEAKILIEDRFRWVRTHCQ